MIELLKTVLYYPLLNALMFLVWLIPGHDVGLAIILLTVIVNLLLLPNTIKSRRQQKRLQELQPQIQKIQEKYKDDRQKQAQAVSEFYRENKINPLGACLPLLIQLPILVVLYYVFVNGLDTSRFSLLYSFVPRPEFIDTNFLGINLSVIPGSLGWDNFAQSWKYWVLPVLAGAVQFYQGYQMAPKTKPGEGNEMANMISKQMLYLMPFFTLFIAGRFPAALPLYWIVNTLFAVAVQFYLNKLPKNDKESPKSEKNVNMSKTKGVEVTVRKKNA